MNPNVKKQWIEALRSGKYKQGKFGLRSGDKFCCLGVLCDLAVKQRVIPEPSRAPSLYPTIPDSIFYSWNVFVYDGHTGIIPPKVCEWSGLEHSPEIKNLALASYNDSGKSFKEIADLIEEHL